MFISCYDVTTQTVTMVEQKIFL